MLYTLAVALAIVGLSEAAPLPVPEDTGFKFPITFENGKIGVNFLGFHAAAGLGGLLTGNAADGGLQAEAGTPFGQKAWAGLGGGLNGEGRSSGGLYAGATAGGGIGAKAGIGGRTGPEGSYGTSYAGASAGGLHRNRVKTIGQPVPPPEVVPVIPAGVSGNVNLGGNIYGGAGAGGYGRYVPNQVTYIRPQAVGEIGIYKQVPVIPRYTYRSLHTASKSREGHTERNRKPSLPLLKIEFTEDYSPFVPESNIQVVTKKEKTRKTEKIVVEKNDLPLPVYDLDVRSKNDNPLPPPPPPPAPLPILPVPEYPIYVEKTKYKLRRRPHHHHHRKYVVVTKDFIQPPPEIPIVAPGEGIVEGPGIVAITKKVGPTHIVNDAINVPVPALDAAEDIVGSFAKGVEEPRISAKSGGVEAKILKPIEIKIEATKSINVEASKPSL